MKLPVPVELLVDMKAEWERLPLEGRVYRTVMRETIWMTGKPSGPRGRRWGTSVSVVRSGRATARTPLAEERMESFRVQIEIGDVAGGRFENLEALVDPAPPIRGCGRLTAPV